MIPDITNNLQHKRSISSQCMQYKIFQNPMDSHHSKLFNLFHPKRVTYIALLLRTQNYLKTHKSKGNSFPSLINARYPVS